MSKRSLQYLRCVLFIFISALCVLPVACGGGGGSSGGGTAPVNPPVTPPPPFQPPAGITVRINKIDATSCSPVDVYVSVSDQNSDPVVGLTQQDFTVLADGAVQTINNFQFSALVAEPIVFSMVLDYSLSLTAADVTNMTSAASTFVRDLYDSTAPAVSWGEIIKFATQIDVVQPFTDNSTDLISAIDAPRTLAAGTFLYDALGEAIINIDNFRASPPTSDLPPQSILIVISDGQDHTSVTYTKDEIIINANTAGINIVSIAFGKDTQGQQDLFDLASGTNGLYFYAPTSNDLQAILDQLLVNIADQYILSFNSPAGSSLLEVDVTTPGGNQGTDSLVYACP